MHLAGREGPDVQVVDVDQRRELLQDSPLEVFDVDVARDGLQQDMAAFRAWRRGERDRPMTKDYYLIYNIYLLFYYLSEASLMVQKTCQPEN